jgi:hypothetical protein
MGKTPGASSLVCGNFPTAELADNLSIKCFSFEINALGQHRAACAQFCPQQVCTSGRTGAHRRLPKIDANDEFSFGNNRLQESNRPYQQSYPQKMFRTPGVRNTDSKRLPCFCASLICPYNSRALRRYSDIANILIHRTCAELAPVANCRRHLP